MIKRIFDLLLSSCALFFLMPLLIFLAVAIGITMGRPVLFKQARPGLNAKIFYMWKFRSMNDQRDADGNLLPDEKRITKLGHFIRNTSLDELPALWCVIKGDMSLVGPRPLLIEYLERYSPTQARRHEVKPGITGWAQVNGRNAISWEEKFHLDVWYVDNNRLLLDIKILFLTLKKVIYREGISQDGHATMPVFMGSKSGENEQNHKINSDALNDSN